MSFKVGDKVSYGLCTMTVHFVSGDAITCVQKVKDGSVTTFESVVLNAALLKLVRRPDSSI
ncbi:hypothetical protein GNZ06_10060 [Aeromonas jandaei]|uniref:hypothetical protein n=1 Tax=Aeromonas jandaei TaxID=650 RepID=UPI001931DB23|nr:hypothetical protein [Aeromonas jandaei]MBM0490503.1 hypothetical protein [Aeromonas jandaei]MBM0569140.1 hypothetical protein [Aeromonas jandaei]